MHGTRLSQRTDLKDLNVQAHLAAAEEADADGGKANSARARVDEHAVVRLQAATDHQRVVCRAVRDRHSGSLGQAPVVGHPPVPVGTREELHGAQTSPHRCRPLLSLPDVVTAAALQISAQHTSGLRGIQNCWVSTHLGCEGLHARAHDAVSRFALLQRNLALRVLCLAFCIICPLHNKKRAYQWCEYESGS